ncbi:hypothetical protein SK571_38325 [Lentzea sp. BCCO 10_0798]|uniref:PPE family protein n=1 Tax=Lentzea kristufekii TaxID=3095430 RepID=A0ABU4U3W4_9PSEU|nr:hypothetical protein [Lentzea sp. BCCO 10_0798]MDX8055265.1 hypothetical protein [Lentzea sp. BCCO 10_0798]
MAYDRPQVPQPNANYPGHSHAAMHKQAMDGNEPGLAGEIAAEWKSISSDLVDVAVGLNTVVNGLRAGWTGSAGAAASQALTKVGNFTDQLSSSFSATSGVINRQVEAAESTKNKFPKEVPFDPQQMLKDAATSLNPFKMAAAPFEMMAQREKSQAAKQEAERVMQERDHSLAAAAAGMPTFEEAPQLPNGDQGVTTTSSTTYAHTTNSVNPPAQFGNPGVGNPAVGTPGVGTPGTGNLGSPGLNTGTTNTSWAAPPVTRPNPQGNNQLPNGGGNPSKPFMPGPGPIPPGLRPNDPRAAGRGGGGRGAQIAGGAGGRGAGGFGAGSAGGAGSAAGRGSFGPSNPGGAAGVTHGPEGTARGGNAASAGRAGATGPVGAGGAGAGAGNGEEDKEHKSNYLVPTDEYFDDDRMVAPPVIGG